MLMLINYWRVLECLFEINNESQNMSILYNRCLHVLLYNTMSLGVLDG